MLIDVFNDSSYSTNLKIKNTVIQIDENINEISKLVSANFNGATLKNIKLKLSCFLLDCSDSLLIKDENSVERLLSEYRDNSKELLTNLINS